MKLRRASGTGTLHRPARQAALRTTAASRPHRRRACASGQAQTRHLEKLALDAPEHFFRWSVRLGRHRLLLPIVPCSGMLLRRSNADATAGCVMRRSTYRERSAKNRRDSAAYPSRARAKAGVTASLSRLFVYHDAWCREFMSGAIHAATCPRTCISLRSMTDIARTESDDPSRGRQRLGPARLGRHARTTALTRWLVGVGGGALALRMRQRSVAGSTARRHRRQPGVVGADRRRRSLRRPPLARRTRSSASAGRSDDRCTKRPPSRSRRATRRRGRRRSAPACGGRRAAR